MRTINLFKGLLVSLMLMISASASAATTDYDFKVDDLFYKVNSDRVSVSVTDYTYRNIGDYYTGVVIPETVTYNDTIYNVTSIGDYAFAGSFLLSITIPQTVTSIATSAFNITVRKVIWLPNTPPDGYSSVKSYRHYVANEQYSELSSELSYRYPELPTVIVYPFLSSIFTVDGIRYVVVSPSERTCDAIDCAYDNTATNVKIGNTVSFIGMDMKVNQLQPYLCLKNDYVKSVEIDYEGNIPISAFSNCTNAETFNIKAKVIEGGAFQACTKNKTLTLKTDSIGSSAFKRNGLLSTVDLDVITIDEEAFVECYSLTSVTLGERVKSIDVHAFSGCRKLQSVVLPNSLTYLGRGAFDDCQSLASVHIGSGLTNIEENTFYDCRALSAITIPANIMSIGNNVFVGCTDLAEVNIADRETELSLGYTQIGSRVTPFFVDCPLKTVYIGGNITYGTSADEGYSPFYGNATLETVTITDKETEISENEFYGCTALKNITMGDGVKSIGNGAFSGCASLESISFGNGMKTIGLEAFSGCTAVSSLVSHTDVPPTCAANALGDINKWGCMLHVPVGTKAQYAAADQWKDFFFVEDDVTGIDGIVADNADANINAENGNIIIENTKGNISVYTLSGAMIQNVHANGESVNINVPAKGMYIVKTSKGVKKIAL